MMLILPLSALLMAGVAFYGGPGELLSAIDVFVRDLFHFVGQALRGTF
jgi:hypothetical protein